MSPVAEMCQTYHEVDIKICHMHKNIISPQSVMFNTPLTLKIILSCYFPVCFTFTTLYSESATMMFIRRKQVYPKTHLVHFSMSVQHR